MKLTRKHLKVALLAVVFGWLFLGGWQEARAAVAHDAASESHTGTTGSASQASFSWTHTPTGTPRGVIVFVYTISATDKTTSVTYGGVAMTRITGGAAVDTATEPGRVDTFFLGASVPTGAQTVTVNRTNDTTVMYATAQTQTAGADTDVTGIVLLQENQAMAEQSVDDGSPGVDSVRYAGAYFGGAAPPAVGANSTLLNNIDLGVFGVSTARETTAGQGARLVGFSTAADDAAAVHLAVREIVSTFTQSSSRWFDNASSYDLSSAIVDPSTATDTPNAIVVDPDGEVMYLAGWDAKPGNDQWRVEKRKLSNGNRNWQTTPNPSSGNDRANALAVDIAQSDLYVVGRDNAPGDNEWRIEKYNLNGISQYATTSNPTSSNDAANGIALDGSARRMFIVGIDRPAAGDGEWRIEARKFIDGSLDYATTSNPSAGVDEANAIAVDPASDSMYVVGVDNTGADDRWRLEKRGLTNGGLIYAVTNNPSTGVDIPKAVALDVAGGAVYIAGRDAIPGNGEWRIEKRLTSDGSLVYAQTSNPTANLDVANSIAIDTAAGVMYVAGKAASSTSDDIWRIEKRNLSDGSLVYATSSNPGINSDEANGIAIDTATGHMYVTGQDSAPGSGDTRWRVEKRNLSDGAIAWGLPLAAQNTVPKLTSTGQSFRLRMLLHVDTVALGANSQQFKLQFAQRSGTCDTAFVGETYADVTTITDIRFDGFPGLNDGSTTVAVAGDPTHGGDTVTAETYEEANNFTNEAAIGIGQDGLWDFSLKDRAAAADSFFCFRAVKSDGSLLNTYSVIPEIQSAAYQMITSGANQVFDYQDANPQAISAITLTSGGGGTNLFTAANDIRIAIATATVNMLWDTTDVVARFRGAASTTRVSTSTVSYEGGGSALVIPVDSDFESGERLKVNGLKFTSFNAAAASSSGLLVYLDGASDTSANGTNTAQSVIIRGTLALGEHGGGQATNKLDLGASSVVGAELFNFRFTPAGESASSSQLLFSVTGKGFACADFTNMTIFADFNSNGLVNGADTNMNATASCSINSLGDGSFTLTFATFASSSVRDYIVRSDVAGIDPEDKIKIDLKKLDITATGKTSLQAISATGNVTSASQFRSSLKGGGAGTGDGGGGTGTTGGGTTPGGGGGTEPPPPGGGGTGGGGGGGGGGGTLEYVPSLVKPLAAIIEGLQRLIILLRE